MRFLIWLLVVCLFGCTASVHFPEGGASFASRVGADSDFLFYPYRDSLSSSDSINYTIFGTRILHAFHEPNISLRPAAHPIYRLFYMSDSVPSVLITLTEDRIVVKEGASTVDPYLEPELRLSCLEQKCYEVMRDHFPLSEYRAELLSDSSHRTYNLRRLDSLEKLEPRIGEAAYYVELYKKAAYFDEAKFHYTERIFPISPRKFARLANGLNQSGFWEPMQRKEVCGRVTMTDDDESFFLEANSGRRYTYMRKMYCPELMQSFHRACQELLNAAGMGERIHLQTAESEGVEVQIELRDVQLKPVPDTPEKRPKRKVH